MPDHPAPRRPGPDGDDLSDRQVEVLLYRVLAAIIAFLLAAALAAFLNSDDTSADDQQVSARPAGAAVPSGTAAVPQR